MNFETTPISIVTVCYNAGREIEKTMRSVLSQTYSNIEYIIIDGKSTDGTLEVINRVRDDYNSANLILLSEPDNGIYDAMNKAIKLASGEWINFMNAGDTFFSPNAIEKFFLAANVKDDVDILYGDVVFKYPFGNYYRKCDHDYWCHQSLFSRSSIQKKYLFDLSYKIMADADFIHKAQMAGSKMQYVPVCVSVYECFYGLSSTSDEQVFLEKSRILGVKKTMLWHVRRLYYRYMSKIRNFMPMEKRISNVRKRVTKNTLLKKIELY